VCDLSKKKCGGRLNFLVVGGGPKYAAAYPTRGSEGAL